MYPPLLARAMRYKHGYMLTTCIRLGYVQVYQTNHEAAEGGHVRGLVYQGER